MKKTLIVGVALALAPVFALAADDTKKSAATPSTSSSMSKNDQFQTLDKNKDGYLSRDEFAEALRQFWLELDAGVPGHRLLGP